MVIINITFIVTSFKICTESVHSDCLVQPYRTCFTQFRRFHRQTEIHALYILPLSQHLNSLGMQRCLFILVSSVLNTFGTLNTLEATYFYFFCISHISKHQNKLKFVCIKHFRGAALYTVGHQRALHFTNCTTTFIQLFLRYRGHQ